MAAISELIWVGSYGTTTIDQICEKAGVKKGSFYYFFDSKTDLAVAAIDADWEKRRTELDGIFSPTVPPLLRLKKFCDYGVLVQSEIKAKYGCVLGCPLFSLGAEVSTQEARLQKRIQEALDQKRKYLESAIRDAHAAGLVDAPDAAGKARTLFAYYEGLLTEARIRNDLSVLGDAIHGIYELLGAVFSPLGPPEGTLASPLGPPEGTLASPLGPPEGTVASPLGHPEGTLASPLGHPEGTVASPGAAV